MDQKLKVFLCLIFSSTLVIAFSNNQDITGLKSLKWKKTPPTWKEGSDPCGDKSVNKWEGLDCIKSRVTSVRLSSMGLTGQLSGDIDQLSELRTLDLSFNKELTGQLPESIGNLKKLTSLILAGCSFSGKIPDTIGNLQELVVLSLNSNHFNGLIPRSIGNLSKLTWLDMTDNDIGGPIPVSDRSGPGLDMLLQCRHFHFGKNKLTGPFPAQLFNSDMTLIHVLFYGNKLSGNIPFTLRLVQTLQVIDLSNNSFEASDFPSWFSTLRSLQTLALEDTQLQGQIPSELFSLPSLETVKLKNNMLNGSLDVGTSYSNHLRLIELQRNSITDFQNGDEVHNIQISLMENPICGETGSRLLSYCNSSALQSNGSYVTAKNCIPSSCSANQLNSPNCRCAYPYTGTLFFKTPSFSDLESTSYYKDFEKTIMNFFKSYNFSVDSVSLSNPAKDNSSQCVKISLAIFPLGQDCFNHTGISDLGFCLSNQSYKAPPAFGPYYFIGDDYETYRGIEVPAKSKRSSVGIVAAAVGGSALVVVLLLFVGVHFFYSKRRAEREDPSVRWARNKSQGRAPRPKGARWFSFKELKKYTNNFSAENEIGTGGYGKVYLGNLPTGEMIAIKRAKRLTTQGGVEFKTEIELLSRVHHKNLVNLVGFCFEQGEQMLVYEYVPNGNLKDCISGKSGVRLDWRGRLKVALDTARGLAYLHELADPPIIHRDIKSTNVLLDNHLNAKVADFGLSKLMEDDEIDHVTTQVKGTMGYIDPEYYTTQQLTEKSDVYSFGVLLLELITARKPVERGKHIVREVKAILDKTKDLYNLQTVLDQAIGFSTRLNGFERFVDLAMRCVEDERVDRPTMSEVVKEIENIMQKYGSNADAGSTSTSISHVGSSNEAVSFHPYSKELLEHKRSISLSIL